MPGIHHQEDENHEAQQKQQDQCRLVLPNLLEASEDFVEIHVTTIYTACAKSENLTYSPQSPGSATQ